MKAIPGDQECFAPSERERETDRERERKRDRACEEIERSMERDREKYTYTETWAVVQGSLRYLVGHLALQLNFL